MNHFEEFVQKFKPLLTASVYKQHQFNRYPSFEFIAKELLSKNKPLKIIETGTLRKDDDWLGYGHSTLVWDWILSKKDGRGFSVDIDLDAIKFARTKCNHFDFIHCDSIGYLRGADAQGLDLLFLDSYDWSRELHISSCLHHIAELGTIYDILPSGCLIAVDDRHTDMEGKHVLVELFFTHIIKINPVVKTHIIVWRKP